MKIDFEFEYNGEDIDIEKLEDELDVLREMLLDQTANIDIILNLKIIRLDKLYSFPINYTNVTPKILFTFEVSNYKFEHTEIITKYIEVFTFNTYQSLN